MFVVLTVFFIFLISSTSADECRRRNYGTDQIVCVCDSIYCDTIPRPAKVVPPFFLVYTSDKAGLRFNKQTETFAEINKKAHNQILVDSTQKYQKILGWGGALTDATGINIDSLGTEARENLLKSYFSEDGIEYNLCRVPMGGTDFSTHGYSYADEEDKTLDNFQLAPEDFLYKLPYLKKMQNLTNGIIQFLTSTWTAPKWMKTNAEYSGFGFLKEEMYQTWADYFIKFLDKYHEEGIKFWGISTGNEPSLGVFPVTGTNSVGWTPEKMAKWILNNLGPAVRNSKHSDIKIMILDDQRLALPWFVDIALENNTTRDYIDGIAVHWYLDRLITPDLLSQTHEHFPEKFILSTEGCVEVEPLGSWEGGELYSSDIIENLLHWVGGWVDWNMALNLEGGPTYTNNFVHSPIIVNATAGEFYKQPTYYNLGHFSKFVPKGSVRISSSSFDFEVPVVAFQRPDNGTVVVILNKRREVVPVTLTDYWRGTAQLNLSAKSITTLLYW